MDWNFRANQWYDQTRFYKIQLLCEIEEYWRIFHDVIAENGPFCCFGVYVRWLWFKINTDLPKQTDALINQEILMCSSCLNLKQISVAFMSMTLWLKIDLSELKRFDSRRFRFPNSTQIFSKKSYTGIQQKIMICSSCVNLKQIGVVFVMLCLKIDLSEL